VTVDGQKADLDWTLAVGGSFTIKVGKRRWGRIRVT
jgi:hypothetical protein